VTEATDADGLHCIVVGDDGSSGAAAAMRFTAIIAAQSGARVVAVKAYSPLDELGQAKPPIDFPALEKETRRRFETERCAVFAKAGVECRALLVEDPDAVKVIADAAREVDADLVVVGSHGRTGWRERILGRVASKLPHELHCPLTIVPAPKTP
jgi:nucleotide-binding universal stress UspA family protein